MPNLMCIQKFLIVGGAITHLPPWEFCNGGTSCILKKCIDDCLKTGFPKGGAYCFGSLCCCNWSFLPFQSILVLRQVYGVYTYFTWRKNIIIWKGKN